MWQCLGQCRRQRSYLLSTEANHALVDGVAGQCDCLKPACLKVIANDADLHRTLHHSLQCKPIACGVETEVLDDTGEGLERFERFYGVILTSVQGFEAKQ